MEYQFGLGGILPNVATEEDQAYRFYKDELDPTSVNAQMREDAVQTARPPTIVNIVCSFNTASGKLDLPKIASVCSNVQYNPRRFTALIMRRSRPKATALIFNTGKVVVVGCQSLESAKKMSRTFASILKKHIDVIKFREFSIYNIVSNAKFPFRVNLATAKEEFNTDDLDESNEHFPGLHAMYKSSHGNNIAVTIFATGSIVFMGAKSKEEIDDAYADLMEKLRKHQTTEEPI